MPPSRHLLLLLGKRHMAEKVTPHVARCMIPGTICCERDGVHLGKSGPGRRKLSWRKAWKTDLCKESAARVHLMCIVVVRRAARRSGQIWAAFDRFLMSFLNNRRIALSHHIHKRWLHFGVPRQQKGHLDCDIRTQKRREGERESGLEQHIFCSSLHNVCLELGGIVVNIVKQQSWWFRTPLQSH